jgi:hypothetical protein
MHVPIFYRVLRDYYSGQIQYRLHWDVTSHDTTPSTATGALSDAKMKLGHLVPYCRYLMQPIREAA